MKTIILISCSSRKASTKCRAEQLYTSSLFKSSLAYAKQKKCNDLYILSAKHGLLQLNKVIEPYNVTLTYVSPSKRHLGLKVLDKQEKIIWGDKVAMQLSKVSNLQKDVLVFLAGKEYVQPLRNHIKNIQEPLAGKRQGERLSFLKSKITKNYG